MNNTKLYQSMTTGEIIAADLAAKTASLPLHHTELNCEMDYYQLDVDLADDFNESDYRIYRAS